MKASEIIVGNWYTVLNDKRNNNIYSNQPHKVKAVCLATSDGKRGGRHLFAHVNVPRTGAMREFYASSRAVISPTDCPLPEEGSEEWVEQKYNAWHDANEAHITTWYKKYQEDTEKALNFLGIPTQTSYGTRVIIDREGVPTLLQILKIFVEKELFTELDNHEPPVLPYNPDINKPNIPEQKGTS